MKFTKMVGAGNDFIIFNGLENNVENPNNLAVKICNRKFGVGADGIMIVKYSYIADIKMLYYNSDGSRGEMCGNGIRCFAKYVYDNKIINKKIFTIETMSGIKTVWLNTNDENEVNSIKVNMGYPIFESRKIPVNLDSETVIMKRMVVDGKEWGFSSLLVGVPHTVIFCKSIQDIDINNIGSKIETNSIFPAKTNVNFVEIIDKTHINNYTWERGAGRTLACGTGCCASVVVGHTLGILDSTVEVTTEGGILQIELVDNEIYMSGDAVTICLGEFLD